MQIVNQARINFEYKMSGEKPIITETILSNKVITCIIDYKLNVEKQVNKESASIFDILTYKVIIKNISNETVSGIVFKDIVPKGTRFITNSFKVNGVKKRCIILDKDILVGDLQSNESTMISFKVVILDKSNINDVKNYASISYDFIYNIEKLPDKITIQTNEVSTQIKNNLFSQFGIQSCIKLPCNYICNIFITSIYESVDVIRTKIINGINGYEVLVIGKVTYDIYYEEYCTQYNNKLKVVYIEGFSECIAVPNGIRYCKINNINVMIETLDFQFVDKNLLVIDSQLLLNLGI